MLVALRERLAERGIQLLMAKPIGQVRDVVATAEPAADFTGRHDSIDAAVNAARAAATPHSPPQDPTAGNGSA
jgi:hypothetical protein